MSFGSRLRAALRPVPTHERENAYLNASTSLHDLERRQREVDQGLFRRRGHTFPL